MKTQYTVDSWPAERWPNFTFLEIACRHSGLCYVDEEVMDAIQDMRIEFGKPMNISSGYRHDSHPDEAAKAKGPGAHFTGKAFDVVCYGLDALQILGFAQDFGFEGFGIKQHGPHEDRFLHIDHIQPGEFHAKRPWIWTYSP